jgi:hypothetical protein
MTWETKVASARILLVNSATFAQELAITEKSSKGGGFLIHPKRVGVPAGSPDIVMSVLIHISYREIMYQNENQYR